MKKNIDDYEKCIKYYYLKLSTLPTFHPEYIKLEEQISRQVSKWADLVGIVVFAANNEHVPWTEKELGLPILPMPLKSDCGFQQTSDYLFQVGGMWGGLAIERKGVTRKNGYMQGCDLYSTLFNKSNRDRFKKEFLRFQQDPRLQQFFVICECSYGEYLSFAPRFSGKKLSPIYHNGASRQSRIGTLASLELDGCHVIFAGSRIMAIELYRAMIRIWVIKHYETILRLK